MKGQLGLVLRHIPYLLDCLLHNENLLRRKKDTVEMLGSSMMVVDAF